ncbi:hypothetical protein C1645_743529 [Glomus cerebriforme]|uniref:Uncharacterized protein n=1 Tax=Glomus cerebriforme TaxID=658196 RepID=A0A397SDK2_9GLOM|nr:hypothetical protein C1645_743529 [Glomus cerebriforme]
MPIPMGKVLFPAQRDGWWNVLDPQFNHEPFSREEKNYIYKKANLQAEMKTKFGKFRSRNCFKNIWYNKKRKLKAKNRVKMVLSIPDNKDENESEYVDELEHEIKHVDELEHENESEYESEYVDELEHEIEYEIEQDKRSIQFMLE